MPRLSERDRERNRQMFHGLYMGPKLDADTRFRAAVRHGGFRMQFSNRVMVTLALVCRGTLDESHCVCAVGRTQEKGLIKEAGDEWEPTEYGQLVFELLTEARIREAVEPDEYAELPQAHDPVEKAKADVGGRPFSLRLGLIELRVLAEDLWLTPWRVNARERCAIRKLYNKGIIEIDEEGGQADLTVYGDYVCRILSHLDYIQY